MPLNPILKQRIEAFETQSKHAGRWRSLPESQFNDTNLIDFWSNDYLGLCRSTLLSEQIQTAVRDYNQPIHGSSGSRLLSGNHELFEMLEQQACAFFGAPSGLLFGSGYAANLALPAVLSGRNDTILYDQYCHVSLKEGIRLSQASRYSFRHNDLNDLEGKLSRASGMKIIMTESLFSMNGDFAPLSELAFLAQRYDAVLVIDEAHSGGLWAGGQGLCAREGIAEQAIRIFTFGKAVGVQGAFVACPDIILKNYLINLARPFIYSTAFSPWIALAISCGLCYIQANHEKLFDELKKNMDLFVRLSGSSAAGSPVNMVRCNDAVVAANLAYTLKEAGFKVSLIRSPTVAIGQEGIRICLHSSNSVLEIEQLWAQIKKITG